MRLGSTNREADAALIAELARRTSIETFDEQPVPDMSSEAIDFAAASQCFAERRPLRRRDLEALGRVSRHQGRTVPTVGGLLLFGRERLSRYPDAWMQVGRFAAAVPPAALREALVNARWTVDAYDAVSTCSARTGGLIAVVGSGPRDPRRR